MISVVLKPNGYFQVRQGQPGRDIDVLDQATEKEVLEFLFEYYQNQKYQSFLESESKPRTTSFAGYAVNYQ